MRILHCSDIHLGKRPFGNEIFSQKRYEDYYKVFNQIADRAIEEKVEVFMVAGDLFDKRDLSPDNLRRSEIIFEKLKTNNIKVLLIEGNHDNTNKYEEINSWLHYLEEKAYCKRLSYEKNGEEYKFIPYKIEDVNFYGLGYPGFVADKVLEELELALNPQEKNIVLIHTALGGGEEEGSLPGLIKSSSLKNLKDKVIYIAGGHYHSKSTYPKEEPYFFIPGSPEYWNILNEKSDEKGFFIFDTNTYKFDFIKVEQRKRMKISTCYTSLEDYEESIKNLLLTGEELLIVKLILQTNSYVSTKELEEIAERNGALKSYVVPVFEAKNQEEEALEGTHTLGQIEKSVMETWEGFDGAYKYLQDLKEYQNNDNEDLFFETFDKMLEELLNNDNK